MEQANKDLFETIEGKLLDFNSSMAAYLQKIKTEIARVDSDSNSPNIRFDYLREKVEQTTLQLNNNFVKYSSEMLEKQLELTQKFINHFENYNKQVDGFNPTLLTQFESLSNIKDSKLRARSIETLKKNVDNFYDIFKVSMQI